MMRAVQLFVETLLVRHDFVLSHLFPIWPRVLHSPVHGCARRTDAWSSELRCIETNEPRLWLTPEGRKTVWELKWTMGDQGHPPILTRLRQAVQKIRGLICNET